jgi:serine/threonine-protein kinase
MYIEHGNKIILISVIASLATAVVVGVIFWFLTTNTEIPDVTGKTSELAKAIFEAKGLRVYQEDAIFDLAIPEGCVVKQDRVPGERVRKGTLVKIILSKGPEQILVPYLIKVPLPEAQAQLEKMGLKMGRVTTTASDSVSTDCVVSTFPTQNTAVPRGSNVDVVVSGGAVEVVMPKVTGMGLSRAREALEKLELKVNVRYATSEDMDPGIVIRQNPEANGKAKKGDTVDLWVTYEEE